MVPASRTGVIWTLSSELWLPAVAKWALDMPNDEVAAYLRNTSTHVNSLQKVRLEVLAATNPIAAFLI